MMSVARRASLGLVIALAATQVAAQQENESQLFKGASPSVVTLTAYDAAGARLRKGSGFVIDRSGMLVTNHHVIENAATLEIEGPGEIKHYARAVLSSDQVWDLALVQIEADALPALSLGADDDVRVGKPVHLVGAAVDLENHLFSGIVSGVREHAEGSELLEITNQMYAVTSGAPLLSNEGDVLGVAIFGGGFAQGQNFAVPVSVLRRLIDEHDGTGSERLLTALNLETRSKIEEAERLRSRILGECAANDIVNTEQSYFHTNKSTNIHITFKVCFGRTSYSTLDRKDISVNCSARPTPISSSAPSTSRHRPTGSMAWRSSRKPNPNSNLSPGKYYKDVSRS